MQNLIQTLVSGIAPATRNQTAPQALVLDTLCLLLDILVPKLRPVSASPRRRVRLPAGLGSWLCSVSLPVAYLPAGEHAAVQHP